MSKSLKDYLHLYLGCDVLAYSTFKDGDTGQEITIELDKTIISINSKGVATLSGTIEAQSFKLKLRPLSNITDEEEKEAAKVWYSNYGDSWRNDAARTRYLISKHFDVFDLIKAGLAIDKTTLK